MIFRHILILTPPIIEEILKYLEFPEPLKIEGASQKEEHKRDEIKLATRVQLLKKLYEEEKKRRCIFCENA